jgi:hypothetical protein
MCIYGAFSFTGDECKTELTGETPLSKSNFARISQMNLIGISRMLNVLIAIRSDVIGFSLSCDVKSRALSRIFFVPSAG